jgi:hypothetical protein
MSLIDKLDAMIGELPNEIHPLADIYVGVLKRTSAGEVAEWVKDAIRGTWRDALKRMQAAMSSAELKAELDIINASIADRNVNNERFIAEQEHTVTELVATGLALL